MEKNNNENDLAKSLIKEEILGNVTFYLKWAATVKVLMIVLSILIVCFAFIYTVSLDTSSGIPLWISIFVAGYIFVKAKMVEQHLKWKAYMLFTNYKISNKE